MLLFALLLAPARAASPGVDAVVGGASTTAGQLVGVFGAGVAAWSVCPPTIAPWEDERPGCDGVAASFVATGLIGGAVGGATLGALPVHVPTGRVAVATLVPSAAGALLVAAGATMESDPLAVAGLATALVAAPVAAGVAAATGPRAPRRNTTFAVSPHGLSVAGTF
ncbi:MAG: hypothetical protein R3F59_28475 [Myxococcota bacterium]